LIIEQLFAIEPEAVSFYVRIVVIWMKKLIVPTLL